MIEVSGINHFYDKHHVLKDVNFAIPRGTIAGFIGPNGAGKSTTIKILAGSLVPSQGVVKIDGVDMSARPIEARTKIGFMPEVPHLYPEMQVREYLVHVARLKGMRRQDTGPASARILKQAGLEDAEHRIIGTLSKGNRQRVALAQALMGYHSVLLLDEPTASLDPAQALEMRALIRELSRDATILYASHVLSEISKICTHLILIDDGRIRYAGVNKSVDELEAMFGHVPAAAAAAAGGLSATLSGKIV